MSDIHTHSRKEQIQIVVPQNFVSFALATHSFHLQYSEEREAKNGVKYLPCAVCSLIAATNIPPLLQ